MVRRRLSRYRARVRRKLLTAFREERTPRQIAASFALGIFITALPTGGVGIGLFFVFISVWSWISKPAIFAAVIVLNPVVKPAVYLASFQVGALVLGQNRVRSSETTMTESAWAGIQQLLVGNVVLAVALSGLGYVLLLSLTRRYRRRSNQQSIPAPPSDIRGLFRR
ncbi:DUF2062 domain-containing protein [Natronorubrum sulfidifaciens]|uniref:DUF2062 domain-containing protein n=1 Tax=Natronorubrum sulfidifaciens JCM 14089 TaxID=1230460 RepID=L9W6C1_9EURY|nr:DUF2062 domain-containing protein [Natronorubrum sulfidifaciens]ELY43888.1 hypothetical protein C495_12525 [Natronorubrum sulfidifaciens JCM 14089]